MPNLPNVKLTMFRGAEAATIQQQVVSYFLNDKERFAVFLPATLGVLVCMIAWLQYIRLKKEEAHWRIWLKILLAFGFVFMTFCLERLISLRKGNSTAW